MDTAILSEGKVAVITGGASGIGKAVAVRCIQRGMRVVIVDADAHALQRASLELQQLVPGAHVADVLADVSDPMSMGSVRDQVIELFGGCHVLFLNAGIGGGGGPWTGVDRWRTVMDVNLFGVLHGLEAFVPMMIAQGTPCVIAITGSREGVTTPPSDICYNVAKASVRSLAEGLEHSLRSTKGCLVSSRLLLPGMTATPIAYNTVKRLKGEMVATARAEKAGGSEAMMGKSAVRPETVAGLLLDSIELGGPFYVICPGSTSIEDFKKSYQTHADDLILQRMPLSQFASWPRSRF